MRVTPTLLTFAAPLIGAIWVGGLVAISCVWMKWTGRAIIPRAPRDSLFVERAASGASLANSLPQLGGASRCLLVWVSPDAVEIGLMFPFNLAFIGQFWGLERRALRSVVTAKVEEHWYGRRVLVSFADGKSNFRLKLRNPEKFADAVAGRRIP